VIILTENTLTGSRTRFDGLTKNSIIRSVLMAGIGLTLLLLTGLAVTVATA
jgi:hypothetical protein